MATLREVIRRLPDVINPCEIRVLVASEGFESRPIRSTKCLIPPIDLGPICA